MTKSDRPNSSRVFSGYCPACGETDGVWTAEKHSECLRCGGTVYDDYETFVAVGQGIGGRFVDDDTLLEGEVVTGERYEYRPLAEKWFRITEWIEYEDGKVRERSKEAVNREEVPDKVLSGCEEDDDDAE